MGLKRENGVVRDLTGAVQVGKSIEVRDESGGGLVALFSDEGITPIANPVTTDSRGRYTFFCRDFDLKLTVVGDPGSVIEDRQHINFPVKPVLADVGKLMEIFTDGASPASFGYRLTVLPKGDVFSKDTGILPDNVILLESDAESPVGEGRIPTGINAALLNDDNTKTLKSSVQNQRWIYQAAVSENSPPDDAYAITPLPTPAAYVDGQEWSFKAPLSNVGAATLKVGALAAKAIRKSVDVVLSSNDIKAGQIIVVRYDAANDWFQMLCPTAGGSSLSDDQIVNGWVEFDGTGTPNILASLNVASITDQGVGRWDVVWADDFAAADYAVAGMSISNSTNNGRWVARDGGRAKTAGIMPVRLKQSNGNDIDDDWISIIAVGALA